MSLPKGIAEQKKRIEECERAIDQLSSFRSLRVGWKKLIKRGRLQPVNYYRSMSFLMPKDAPLDMSEIWNWMVKYDRTEARAYHAGVGKMIDGAIEHWTKEVKRLSR